MPHETTAREPHDDGPGNDPGGGRVPPSCGPVENRDAGTDPEFGDLLLVDLLHPDWRNFFTRYRTDLGGFAVVSLICIFIVVATRWLAMIGAGAGR